MHVPDAGELKVATEKITVEASSPSSVEIPSHSGNDICVPSAPTTSAVPASEDVPSLAVCREITKGEALLLCTQEGCTWSEEITAASEAGPPGPFDCVSLCT